MRDIPKWIPKQCPRCDAETRKDQGARGLNRRIETGWRCSNPFCDIAGLLIYQDCTTERMEQLATWKRGTDYYQSINRARAEGRNPFFGAYEQYMKR